MSIKADGDQLIVLSRRHLQAGKSDGETAEDLGADMIAGQIDQRKNRRLRDDISKLQSGPVFIVEQDVRRNSRTCLLYNPKPRLDLRIMSKRSTGKQN